LLTNYAACRGAWGATNAKPFGGGTGRGREVSLFGVRETHLPGFEGATGWLNSEPLTPAALRGRVVLVDFGTYTCINWLRTLPHIRAWDEKYREAGLVLVGIQTPEFEFEQNLDSVRREVNGRRIDWPVAVDNQYEIWRAFSNHYWPALYFVDREGVIRDHHFGEGRYEESERVIQELLGLPPGDLVSVHGEGDEVAADWARLNSPETYLGYERTDNFASPGGVGLGEARVYAPPDRLKLNQWALSGNWTMRQDRVVLNEAGGRILFRFQCRDVHLVLRRAEGEEPVPFRVLLDGEAPGAAHGVDVDVDGNGVVDDDRLYQLVRQPGDVDERTFEITFLERGVEGYVFTFG
jgi:thiol-disulfide isomerase/thioredoxin